MIPLLVILGTSRYFISRVRVLASLIQLAIDGPVRPVPILGPVQLLDVALVLIPWISVELTSILIDAGVSLVCTVQSFQLIPLTAF